MLKESGLVEELLCCGSLRTQCQLIWNEIGLGNPEARCTSQESYQGLYLHVRECRAQIEYVCVLKFAP